MWLTIVYISLLLVGVVVYAYSVYVNVRNRKLQEEGKEVQNKSLHKGLFAGLGIMVWPVIQLTEKWLSSYITNETAMFFFQILVLMVLLLAIGIPVRWIAKR